MEAGRDALALGRSFAVDDVEESAMASLPTITVFHICLLFPARSTSPIFDDVAHDLHRLKQPSADRFRRRTRLPLQIVEASSRKQRYPCHASPNRRVSNRCSQLGDGRVATRNNRKLMRCRLCELLGDMKLLGTGPRELADNPVTSIGRGLTFTPFRRKEVQAFGVGPSFDLPSVQHARSKPGRRAEVLKRTCAAESPMVARACFSRGTTSNLTADPETLSCTCGWGLPRSSGTSETSPVARQACLGLPTGPVR